MQMKLKIRQRLQFFVLLTTFIVFIAAIGYISGKARSKALRDTRMLVDNYAAKYAETIQTSFNTDMAVVRTLAQAYYIQNSLEEDEWKRLFRQVYENVFRANPHFYALWDSWELSHIDPEWELPYGRYVMSFHREDNRILFEEMMRSMTGDPDKYGAAKRAGRESIWEPYPDQIVRGTAEAVLMTTLSVPMFYNNRYIGLVAADITLESLQDMVAAIQPMEDSYAFIVSHKGLFAAHPNTSLFEQSIASYLWQDEANHKITENIARGEFFSYSSSFEKHGEYYYSFAPITIGKTETPWSVCIAVPVRVIQQEAINSTLMSILVGIIGLLIIWGVVWFIAGNIAQPIEQITALMKKLSLGQIDKSMQLDIRSGDELQEMGEAFNVSLHGLIDKTDFAISIGNGNMDADINLLSKDDALGKALKDMQNHLKKAQVEETARQIDDKKRNWATEGYARFGEILRHNNDNMEVLTFNVVQNLVKYLGANQGGIFVLNDEETHHKYLEMKACYAFDRKKYLDKRIEIGEGLVGACFKEAKTIYMTHIPQSYITITSGLGGENPSALLIVPLKLNEIIYGVLELASFSVFEPHQVEFVEKIGESVASTLSTVKTNIRTAQLLEKSQEQAEMMKAQEEEMRQNMEELHATQEEMARKSTEMQSMLDALDASSYVIEYDLKGYIVHISDSYLKLLNISRSEALGSHHAEKMELSDMQQAEYNQFWKDLNNGLTKRQEVKINVKGKEFWLAETYSPIYDTNGQVYKILKIANNISESKQKGEELSREIERLKAEIAQLKKK